MYASAYSTDSDLDRAVDAVCGEVSRALDGNPPDLAVFFVSHAHSAEFAGLGSRIRESTGTNVLLGCTGEAIVGGAEEIEEGPALSVWAAMLPGAALEPFHAEFKRAEDGIACSGLPEPTDGGRDGVSAILVLGEPFSTDPNSLIAGLAERLPDVPVMGGMASGGAGPGMNHVFLNSAAALHGAVGVVIRGGPRVRCVVSQGCRPIGKTYIVTSSDRNIIHGLGGATPMERFGEMLPTLSAEDQQLIQAGVHVGIVMNEYQESFARGDFLIANVMGASEEGSIAIGNRIRTGQTIQFHVRDAVTADEDLKAMLREDRETHEAAPSGALLFTCNGRGSRLFPEHHHDAGTVQDICGPLPLAGFFAQGELGPVGTNNYIHGFTASVALFE
jgi:small ligand-binding sensory domain FIST